MDPAIANQDLRPPAEPRLAWAILLAIMVNVLLIAVVAWGLQTRGSRPQAKAKATAASGAPAHAAAARKVAAQARTACPLRPRLAAAAGGKDGQVFPPADVQGKTGKDIEALLLAGKEAAAAGLVRDAEVDYLTSCRVADALKGAGSIESANARYQLARHYVNAANAAAKAPVPERADILREAQAYFEDSLQRFGGQLGGSHEKTRFAAEGLESARVALAQTANPAAAGPAAAAARMGAGPAAPPAAQQPQSARERAREAVAARKAQSGRHIKPQTVAATAVPARQRGASSKPSFDCRKARSYAERAICSDAGLAQLDRDLGRLHAKAKQAAPDSAGFKRKNDAEWHRREATCRDKACLRRWYADRRQQLEQTLSQASPQAYRTALR